jgi:hypothetical protein
MDDTGLCLQDLLIILSVRTKYEHKKAVLQTFGLPTISSEAILLALFVQSSE